MKRQMDALLPLSAYRELLTAKRAELTLGPTPGVVVPTELGGLSGEDQAPVLHDQFIELHFKRLDSQTLKLIDAALDRLTTGDFGLCLRCNHTISSKRPAAIPWADCLRDLSGASRVAVHSGGSGPKGGLTELN